MNEEKNVYDLIGECCSEVCEKICKYFAAFEDGEISEDELDHRYCDVCPLGKLM